MDNFLIVRHIQSFLDDKQGARSSLVSKFWYDVWSTRPNLEFDDSPFKRYREQVFTDMAKKTIQRYEDINLKIESLRLLLVQSRHMHDHVFAQELIVKALKLRLAALDITLWDPSFVLPDELLQSQTLSTLFLRGYFTLDLPQLSCPRLISLSLTAVIIKGDLFGDLISRFPLIEELKLDFTFTFSGSGRNPFYDRAFKQHKLRYLRLVGLNIKAALSRPHDLWPKFICLKELVILVVSREAKDRWNDARICSPSLELITIRLTSCSKNVNVEFDLPNLRKFKFEGYDLPRLHFKTTSRVWESYIKLYWDSVLCFSLLNQLMLSLSRVSLHLRIFFSSFGDGGYVGHDLPIPTVENLMIEGDDALPPSFLDALFWSCLPNRVKITRCCVRGMEEGNVERFQQLSSLPWKTLLDKSNCIKWEKEWVHFQLK